MIPFVTILGVKVHVLTTQLALEFLSERLKQGKKSVISTINAEFIVAAQSNPEFKNQLNNSQLCTADGVGILWAARLNSYKPRAGFKFLKILEVVAVSGYYGITTVVSRSSRFKVIPEQITGVDFSKRLMELAVQKDLSVFLLGGSPGVAEKAASNIKLELPDLKVAGVFAGKGGPEGDLETVGAIQQDPSDILLVAYGAPKQELWIARNLSKITPKIIIGVGGTFMFWSGMVKRAPSIIRRFGAEWLYRLATQPWRWRRQLALPYFIFLMIKSKT